MTRLEIAEATLMALRPIGADYLGTIPDGRAWTATVRELDGTERRGIGPTPLDAVHAVTTWYADSRLAEYAVTYSDGRAWDANGEEIDLSSDES